MPPPDLNWILSRGKIRLTATPVLYHCEPIWSWRVDSLPDFALLLILEGRGKLILNGSPANLRQGLCYFLKPGTRVEAQQIASYPLFLFLARFDFIDAKGNEIPASQLNSTPESVFIQNVRNLEALAEIVANRVNSPQKDETLITDALNMLVRLLVEQATRHAGAFDSNAYEALHAIENDLARKWTIADLAKEADLSSKQFARSFRLMMNEPPIHYVIRRRMEEAKRQIQQSNLPIEEIAINLGYNDTHFFRAHFLNRIGQTPESLRTGRAL